MRSGLSQNAQSRPGDDDGRRRWRGAMAWGALAVAVLLAGERYLGGRLPVGVDHSLEQAPWLSLRWAGGGPLFDAFTLSGVSFAGNLQAALLYPPRWPFYFLSDWRDYYGLYFFLHLPLAMAGTYVLARGWRMSRTAGLLAAALYGCGGYMAGRPINPVIYYSSAWLPWLALGATAARDAASGRRRLWLTTLAMAMILAIGSPHLYLYGLIAYALVAVGMGLGGGDAEAKPAGRLAALGRDVARRAVHLALAVALVAPAVAPGVLSVGSSVRTTGSVEENLAASIPPKLRARVLLGGTGGSIFPEYIDNSCYIGAPALLLILVTLARRRPWRDGRVRAATLMSAFGLTMALGKYAGLDKVLPWIPGLAWLTGPNRALVLAALGLALLAGLGLDRAWTPRRAWMLAVGAVLPGLAAGAWFILRAERIAALGPGAPGIVDWLRAWLASPPAVDVDLFPWLDAAIGLLAAALATALLRRRPRALRAAWVAVAFLQCLHFGPRVWPPLRDRSFYDPPATVAWLAEQARHAQDAPFRVMGYDPLRVHDNDVNNGFLLRFLVPQLSTLYGLEDIQGFDPLIPESYARLVEQTAGRSITNDRLRNLDAAWPDPRLLDLCGVRYLLGQPYDRRVTNLPLTLTPQSPGAAVQALGGLPATPATHWLFVSLLDSPRPLPLGAQVARLRVVAAEGTFDFPIRNGLETADVNAARDRRLQAKDRFRVEMNSYWTTPYPDSRLGYEIQSANWRGQVAFGRPLTLRALRWELTDPSVALNVSAQACRLATPPNSPWRLATGRADDFAPVFEYLPARPRAVVVEAAARNAAAGGVQIGGAQTGAQTGAQAGAQNGDDDATRTLALALTLADATPVGRARWLRRDARGMSLEVDSPRPALLVLRQPWTEGWRGEIATISKVTTMTAAGRATRPPRSLGLGLMGLDAPAGKSRVDLTFMPRAWRLGIVWGWWIGAPCLILAAWLLDGRRRKRPRRNLTQRHKDHKETPFLARE
jgi:hypothetical protein